MSKNNIEREKRERGKKLKICNITFGCKYLQDDKSQSGAYLSCFH